MSSVEVQVGIIIVLCFALINEENKLWRIFIGGMILYTTASIYGGVSGGG